MRILGSKVVGSRICVDTEYCQFGSISDIISGKQICIEAFIFLELLKFLIDKKNSAHFQHGLDLQAVSLIARGVALGLGTWVGSLFQMVPDQLFNSRLVKISRRTSPPIWDYLHSNEIVHRSLRGSHILVNSKGVVKLSGFRYSIDLTRQREKKKSFKYVYDPEGLPWLAPEILEQNCCGFGLLSDMYRLVNFSEDFMVKSIRPQWLKLIKKIETKNKRCFVSIKKLSF